MKRFWIGAGVIVLAVAGSLYVANASWRAAPNPEAETRIISHRGVHQTFHREGLDNETCTAERIDPPTHNYLENTLASMEAAFAAGAHVVELDVHPTTDGFFAVFHDWTVDCRTEGAGRTRDHDLATLKALDIGHGYTADGGASFPFRGRGVGLMPELGEVLEAFGDRSFLVNFKSNEAREGDMLAEALAANPGWRDAIWGVYGGDPPSFRAQALIGDLAVISRRQLMECLLAYAALGWSGWVPGACHDTTLMVPINYAPLLWGWPDLFTQRMREAGTTVILAGPFETGDAGAPGIDTPELLARVPAGFDGYLWTNTVETIGPLLAAR